MDRLSLDQLSFHGRGLTRPECVLAHGSGLLFASEASGPGGVSIVDPAGDAPPRFVLARDPPEPLRPNGIALEPDGAFLLAHLGDERGGIFRLHPDGRCEAVVTEIEGRPLPPTNFVMRDERGRLWITVSTRLVPRARDYRPEAETGFIALYDEGRTRIVAEGLGYTNECQLSADGRTLFVNETFARRTSTFAVAEDGSLSQRRILARHGEGCYPDGLALDREGGLWIVSIVSNRVLRLDPEGQLETVLEDSDAKHLAWTEAAYREGTMGRPHLDGVVSRRLRNVSSLAFGGADLRSAYLGCLLGDSIAAIPSAVPGLAPLHWRAPLDRLRERFPDLGELS